MSHIEKAKSINEKLDEEIEQLLSQASRMGHGGIPRRWFIMLPHDIALEVMHLWLRRLEVEDIDRRLVEKLTIGIKTAKPGKKLDIDGRCYLLLTKRSARIVARASAKSVGV